LVGSGDGAHAILEVPVLDLAAPAGEIEAKVLPNLLRVAVGDHHRTRTC
jgi:hypothetical protein